MGYTTRWALAVEMFEDPVHHLSRTQILHLVHDEAFAAHHPTFTNMKHLHSRFKVILGEPNEIQIFTAFGDHLLFLHSFTDRIKSVT